MVITASIVGAIFYFGEGRNLSAQKFSGVAKEAAYLVPQVQNGINELLHDTQYLSELPHIQNILVSEKDSLRDRYRQEIHPFLTTFLNVKKQYLSVRIIDFSNRMIELQLGDVGYGKKKSAKNDEEEDDEDEEDEKQGQNQDEKEKGEIIPPEMLNVNFKLSDYPEKRVYLSDIRLLRKHFEVSGRRMPILEAIHPIFDGERAIGLLAITLNLTNTFQNLTGDLHHKNPHAELFLTNQAGDYLIHPDKMRTFGFESGKEYRLPLDFPKARQFYSQNQDCTKKEEGTQDDSCTQTFDPAMIRGEQAMHLTKVTFDPLDKSRFIVLGVKLTFDQALQNLKDVRTNSVIFAGFLVIFVIFTTYYFNRRFTRNLHAITVAAEKYADGEGDLNLFVHSNDEIGVLASSFLSMVHQINERTKRLVKSEEQSRRARDSAEEANRQKTTLLKNLRQQKSELERISKEKDDLLAVVSHDLKNPLAVIEASLKILMEDAKAAPNTSAEKLDLMRRAQNSSKFALNLITDLLDLARLEGGIKLNYEIFALKRVIFEATDSLLLKAKEKNISINVAVSDELKINADYGRILQIINNIVGNAIKFTPIKGVITIKGFLDNSDAKKPMVKIVMSDTGIGIPKSMLDRVFDKYQQVRQKDREMGTGLGLTICKNICQQHLGDITVESEEGKGSIFTVTLPQSLEMAQTAEGVSQTSAVQSILIVDDDADQTALLSSRLKKYNYNILSAKNGLEAIGLCQKILPDIVLLDLEMPIMNGLETLRRLRSLHGASTLPIIIHSSKITPENIELFRPNANDYIQKPAKLSELLGKIQQHIVRPKSKQNFEVSAPANILLIDDSEDIFALFKIYLKKTPHHLEYAASAEAGIKMLESKRFDIIFMDLNLPGMNGIEATAMLKQVGDENSGHFRVALLTAAHLDTVRAEAQKAGVDLVIEKKLSKEKILEYIEQLMAMDT